MGEAAVAPDDRPVDDGSKLHPGAEHAAAKPTDAAKPADDPAAWRPAAPSDILVPHGHASDLGQPGGPGGPAEASPAKKAKKPEPEPEPETEEEKAKREIREKGTGSRKREMPCSKKRSMRRQLPSMRKPKRQTQL